MTDARYAELDEAGTGITEEEWLQGIHLCNELDGLLVVGVHRKGSMDSCGDGCPARPVGYQEEEWEVDRTGMVL
jgi:hypothetical protein